MSTAKFELSLLGRFQLSGPEGPIELTSKKLAALLTFLACSAPSPTRLRRLLGEDAIVRWVNWRWLDHLPRTKSDEGGPGVRLRTAKGKRKWWMRYASCKGGVLPYSRPIDWRYAPHLSLPRTLCGLDASGAHAPRSAVGVRLGPSG